MVDFTTTTNEGSYYYTPLPRYTVFGSLVLYNPIKVTYTQTITKIIEPPLVPKPEDIIVTASTYGTTIPITVGQRRLNGNIIWASNVGHREVGASYINIATFTNRYWSTGGGLRPPPSFRDVPDITGSWFYDNGVLWERIKGTSRTVKIPGVWKPFASFAVSFGMPLLPGQITSNARIIKLWADDKLVYEPGTSNIMPGFNFRFYRGTEVQQADPTIAADVGEENCPAFRDLMYIVIDDLNLEEFGGKVPNIVAEISDTVTLSSVVSNIRELGFGVTGNNSIVSYDLPNGKGYALRNQGSTIYTGVLRIYNLYSNKEIKQSAISVDLTDADELNYTGPLGHLIKSPSSTYGWAWGGSGNSRPIYLIRMSDFSIIDEFGSSSSSLTQSDTNIVAPENGIGLQINTGDIVDEFFLERAVVGRWMGFAIAQKYPASSDIPAGTRLYWKNIGRLGTSGTPQWMACGERSEGTATGYVVHWESGDTTAYITKFIFGHSPGQIPCVTLLSQGIWLAIPNSTNCIFFYYKALNAMMVISSGGIMTAYHAITKAIIWKTTLPAWSSAQYDDLKSEFANQSDFSSGTVAIQSATNQYTIINLKDGTFRTQNATTSTGNSYPSIWDSRTASVINLLNRTRTYLDRPTGDGLTLSSFLEAVSIRAGYAQEDITVIGLDDNIGGYLITNNTSLAAIVDQLSVMFRFDFIESEGKLKFVRKEDINGLKQIDIILTENDFAVLQENRGEQQKIDTIIQEDNELPNKLEVLYIDQENEYQRGVQQASRVNYPVPTQKATGTAQIEAPIIMRGESIRRLLYPALYSMWAGRASHTFRVTQKFNKIEPGDTVSFTLDNISYNVKVNNVMYNGDYSLTVSSITIIDNPPVSIETQLPITPPPNTLLPKYSIGFILDMPLTSYGDGISTVNAATYYSAVAPDNNDNTWPGATMLTGYQPTALSTDYISNTGVFHGIVTTLIPSTDIPFSTDFLASFDVILDHGTATDFITKTYDEVINGANEVIVGAPGRWEVIRFIEATTLATNKVRLTGLMRGRYGTDTFTNVHLIGDTLIVLDKTKIKTQSVSYSLLRQIMYNKAVTVGSLQASAELNVSVITGQSLMPYAPVNYKAELQVNDDVLLTWNRREKFNSSIIDSTGDVPLTEVDERYDLEIVDTITDDVIRTVNNILEPEFLYTEAMQIEDGYSQPMNEITLYVYQINDKVGRGFSYRKTINVEQS